MLRWQKDKFEAMSNMEMDVRSLDIVQTFLVLYHYSDMGNGGNTLHLH
jgi:hypothetical protein